MPHTSLFRSYLPNTILMGPFLTVLVLLFGLMSHALSARDIRIEQLGLSEQNTADGHVRVIFQLSWKDSWRLPAPLPPANWDAAWVFMKFRVGVVDPDFTVQSAANGATVLTVSTTASLRVGMPLRLLSGTGTLSPNTTITAIDTTLGQITLSQPTTSAVTDALYQASRIWEHAWLHENGHAAAVGVSYQPALADETAAFDVVNNPVLGAFFFRTDAGSGDFTANTLALRWNYRAQGLPDEEIIDFQLFAVEMVYSPQGAFFAGGADSENAAFCRADVASGPIQPKWIAAVLPVLQGNDSGSDSTHLSARGNIDLSGTATATLDANFPYGYAAFYAMKYPISQQQYTDFLNSLQRNQQNERTATNLALGITSVTNRYVMSASSSLENRNGIRVNAAVDANEPLVFYCDLSGDGPTAAPADGRDLACNYLSWADLAAYSDWAALRPLSELEFEKLSRGQRMPLAAEFLWGNTQINPALSLNAAGTSDEAVVTVGANAVYGSLLSPAGPTRVGILATGESSRAEAGAGFYGNVDLGGQVWERSISVGLAEGRAYSGLHGNGHLPITALADVAQWPDASALGAGFRGGSWQSLVERLQLADRNRAAETNADRLPDSGGRLARSFPSIAIVNGSGL